MTIEILGTGCAKCAMLYEVVQNALKKAGIDAHIEKIEDPVTILGYGVMTTPALVINKTVVLSGRIPSCDEVIAFLG